MPDQSPLFTTGAEGETITPWQVEIPPRSDEASKAAESLPGVMQPPEAAKLNAWLAAHPIKPLPVPDDGRPLKVELLYRISPSTKVMRIYSQIRLRGKWLSELFPPGSQVVAIPSTQDGKPALIIRPEH